MSDLRFELEATGLRLEGHDLVWITVNRSDIAAEPGQVVDTVRVARRPPPTDVRFPEEKPEQVDPTPWQYDVSVDREVAPGTAHTARLALNWGLDDGYYTAEVQVQRGVHGVTATLFFKVERGMPGHDY